MEALVFRGPVLIVIIAASASLAFATNSVTTTLSSNLESFTLTAGSSTNPGNAAITAITIYSFGAGQDVEVDAYFLSASTALGDGSGHAIPASAFYISDNGSASQALTNTPPAPYYGGAGAGLRMEDLESSTGVLLDTMTFNINLSALPQLPAGIYTGTLYIQAHNSSGSAKSGPQAITLTATLPESLSVSLSGSSVSFTLAAGQSANPGSTSVTATTSWSLKATRSLVGVYAYFSNASAALTDGAGDNIPSSAFSISDNGSASAALANTVPFGGTSAGLELGSATAITSANQNSSRRDAMTFNIDLSGGTLPQLPSGSYTGTLNIQAQATP